MLGWDRIITSLLALPRQEGAASTSKTELVTLEVCLSPGCVADGADKTISELQALAPPNVIVKEGACNSLCGYGPVVLTSSGQKHKQVKEGKILEVLFDPTSPTPVEILEAYHLVQQANECFETKKYKVAIDLYEKAVSVGFRATMDLQMKRDLVLQQHDYDELADINKPKPPIGLDWLIDGRRNEAIACLEIGDEEGALFAAQASCNLSRNTSTESFRVLAQVYERKNDQEAELQALNNMFALPVDESKLSFQEKNDRRLSGFRLQKLEAVTR